MVVRGRRRRARGRVVRFVCCKSRSSVGLLRRDVAGRRAGTGRLFGHVSLVREILEHGEVTDQQDKRQQSDTHREEEDEDEEECERLLQPISTLGLKILSSLSATFFCSMH